MRVSISVPPSLAYVADEQVPDKPQAMSVEDAAYHTVHNYPGGVAALAARMGIPPGTLTHKVNPNNATHHLRPAELLAMQYLSGDVSILHAMAAHLGYTCSKAMPDQADGNVVQAFMHLQMAFADFVRAVADPLQRMETDPHSWATSSEVRRANALAADLVAAVTHTVGSLRACQRPAPKAES